MIKKIIYTISLFFIVSISTEAQTFVHDPVMACEDSVYYLYSTGWNIQMMTSSDRKNWKIHREGVLSEVPDWTKRVPKFKGHIWAPDIMKWHDKWWMAYSCSSFGVNTSAIGLLSSSRLSDNKWNDEGCIIESHKGDNFNAIDPNLIIDENDQPWMVFGSFWDGIQIVKLDTTLHIDTSFARRTIARRYYNNAPANAENPTSKYAGVNAIEAPFVFRHKGWYYLFASWDYCCRGEKSSYRVVVGRSRNVTGPFLDKDGVDMAQGGGTLVIEGDKQLFEAAGHSAVCPSSEGDIFICHGYSIPEHGQSVLIQKKIKWDRKGWLRLVEQ